LRRLGDRSRANGACAWQAVELGGEGGYVAKSGHAAQVADFVTAVHEGRPPAVDGREGRRSLALVSAVYESARTGREVCVR